MAINPEAQALDANGVPVPGLFAAGEVGGCGAAWSWLQPCLCTLTAVAILVQSSPSSLAHVPPTRRWRVACTAPTAWAATRCWSVWCLGGARDAMLPPLWPTCYTSPQENTWCEASVLLYAFGCGNSDRAWRVPAHARLMPGSCTSLLIL